VQSRRVNGKVRQEIIGTLGRLDALQESGALDRLVASLARHSEQKWVTAEALPLIGRWSREYGVVVVFWKLWERLGLHQLFQELYRRSPVELPVEEAIFAMVLNRLIDPDSKLGAYDWIKERVHRPQFEPLGLHHLYRSLDFLEEHIRTIEEALFLKERDLFNLDVDLMFFDTTSTYFEGQGPEGLAERGYSRDKRSDLRQVVIGLVMSREGIPVAHHVFPGNTQDITAFRYAVADLRRRFAIRRVIIVADRGVVSEPLLEALDGEGMGYIIGIPLKKWKAADRVLKRAGRYHKVAENLEVKEVEDNGQRYVVCYNRERESEDARRRVEIVAALEARLAQSGLAGLAKQKGYRRYLKVQNGGQAEVDWRKVKYDGRYDGKFLLRSNTELSSTLIGLAYKELWRVERAFRELKTGLEIRPVRHWTPSRVRGHFGICFLALVMESTLARMLKNPQVSYREALKDLEQVKAVRVELDGRAFLLRTELPGRAYDAFQAVGLRPPPRLQSLTTLS
jgi:transposase